MKPNSTVCLPSDTNVCCDAPVVCSTGRLEHIDLKPLDVGGSGNDYDYLFSFSINFSPDINCYQHDCFA